MTRLGFLVVLLFAASAHAEPVTGHVPFNTQLAAEVYATALTFMAPRTLDPVPVGQLAVWGLHGLTALDPDLTCELRDGGLRLSNSDRVLATAAAPPPDDARAWASVVAALSAVAWDASDAVRRAGTGGVIENFFDEMFNHLDPYSRYVGPGEAAEDRDRRDGQAGAGIELAARGRTVVVSAAVDDGPAALAGIRPGIVVLAVDGQSAVGQDAATVARWIAGPAGTDVVISVRGRDGRARAVRLTRAVVAPETVFADRIADMLVLRVTGFSANTDSRLAQELLQGVTGTHAAAGVVIDLRGNRGGLLREAVAMAETLLPPGVVAVTSGRDPAADRVFRSTGQDAAPGVPVIVAVDGRSASASEILAAALADRGRAVVVGSATLGKGLIQTIAPLPDGGELFVTWSRVLAPRGWPLQGLGVLPQVCTSLGETALAAQLAALADGVQPMQQALAQERAARAPVPAAEALAIRSACPAAIGGDLDLDAARVLIDNPAAYAAALFPPLRPAAGSALLSGH